MKRWWDTWVRLLDRRERGTSLALFRILVAVVVLYSLGSIAIAGLVEVLWVDAAHGGYRQLHVDHWLIEVLGGATPTTVWGLWSACSMAALAMVAGVGGRMPIAVVVLTYAPLARLNGDASGGYDLMIGGAAWLLLLSQANATLSLDAWRRTGSWVTDVLVPAWPRYLAVFQLIVVYASTGLHKLSADWVPGGTHAALYWVFQDPTWNRFEIGALAARYYPATQAATLVTWIWEVGTVAMLAVFLARATRDRPGRLRAVLNRYDLRKPWAAVGIGLHLGILTLLEVGPFSWISLSYYVCLWTPAEIERALPFTVGRRPDRGTSRSRAG